MEEKVKEELIKKSHEDYIWGLYEQLDILDAEIYKLESEYRAIVKEIREDKGGNMTDSEICRAYRTAKNKFDQICIIHELTGKGKDEIIRILLANGERVRIPLTSHGKSSEELSEAKYKNAIRARMDSIKGRMEKLEEEYKMLQAALGM